MNARNVLTGRKLKYNPFPEISILILGDIFSILLIWLLHRAIPQRWNSFPIITSITGLTQLTLFLFIIILFLAIFGNYPGRGRIAVVELRKVSLSLFFAHLTLVILSLFSSQLSLIQVFISWLFCSITTPLIRFVIRNRFSLFKWWGEPVAVLGEPNETISLLNDIQKCRRLGFKPICGLTFSSGSAKQEGAELEILSVNKTVLEQLNRSHIKTILISSSTADFNSEHFEEMQLIDEQFKNKVFLWDNISYQFLGTRKIESFEQQPTRIRIKLLIPMLKAVKRLSDIILSILFLIPTSLVIGVIALLIKLDSPGPIFFKQERIGINQSKIKILKFRTMVVNAESLLVDLLEENAELYKEYETYHKLENDPRITKVGKILRRFSLDELPQFINILCGDLSLVGPRAYMFNELHKIGDEANFIFRVKPGLTGWWQVMGRNATSFDERIRLDKYYINNWSFWMDLYIIIKTFWVVISGEGH